MSKEKLLLVGAGGFGRMVAEQAMLQYDCAFVDDGQLVGVEICGISVVGGLADLPELRATPEGAVRLRNGNPGMVLASDAGYGDEAWASFQGRPVAVGIYRAGELHPSRVFNLDDA